MNKPELGKRMLLSGSEVFPNPNRFLGWSSGRRLEKTTFSFWALCARGEHKGTPVSSGEECDARI